eukprot:364500-Chlamydomonas_euryale.AAC.10
MVHAGSSVHAWAQRMEIMATQRHCLLEVAAASMHGHCAWRAWPFSVALIACSCWQQHLCML